MNLLTDDWIPVQERGEFQYISLKRLLCEEKEWQLSSHRDDMELATLQLAICLTQVVFMPEDDNGLRSAWETPLEEDKYEQGIIKYLDWFDLLHPKTPFMQKADIKAMPKMKNWASPQKLFVGLPEVSSSSASSNAFFNRTDEIKSCKLADAAVALFQQATNGFSLGGSAFSVGLKGSMPLTTLINHVSLRKTLWSNILNKNFLETRTQLLKENDSPTWVNLPKKNEYSHEIGLLRGLFWQPAKIKLVVDENNNATGFLKESGLTNTKGFWQHPHTPFNLSLQNSNDPKNNPFLSARRDMPLWEQMMSFFYLHKDFSPVGDEGCSCALVVQQYKEIWREGINLSVGGYVKGESAESLAGRKHEFFSLSSGWKEQVSEIHQMVSLGLKAQNILNHAVNEFGQIAIEEKAISVKEVEKIIHGKDKTKGFGKKENRFKKELKKKARHEYFNNSEQLVHSIFRRLNMSHLAFYKEEFSSLAIQIFENLISSFEHIVKMQPAIINSRALLIGRLKKI